MDHGGRQGHRVTIATQRNLTSALYFPGIFLTGRFVTLPAGCSSAYSYDHGGYGLSQRQMGLAIQQSNVPRTDTDSGE